MITHELLVIYFLILVEDAGGAPIQLQAEFPWSWQVSWSYTHTHTHSPLTDQKKEDIFQFPFLDTSQGWFKELMFPSPFCKDTSNDPNAFPGLGLWCWVGSWPSIFPHKMQVVFHCLSQDSAGVSGPNLLITPSEDASIECSINFWNDWFEANLSRTPKQKIQHSRPLGRTV